MHYRQQCYLLPIHLGKVPDIMYDERSTYRHDYAEIRPPYAEDLPWRPAECRPEERMVRGTREFF